MTIVGLITIVFGISFVPTVIVSFLTGDSLPGRSATASFHEFSLVVLATSAVISGWRIFFWVTSKGFQNGTTVNDVWWVFAFIGAAITVGALFLRLSDSPGINSLGSEYIKILTMGVYFLIPLVHLSIEVRRQRRTNAQRETADPPSC